MGLSRRERTAVSLGLIVCISLLGYALYLWAPPSESWPPGDATPEPALSRCELAQESATGYGLNGELENDRAIAAQNGSSAEYAAVEKRDRAWRLWARVVVGDPECFEPETAAEAAEYLAASGD